MAAVRVLPTLYAVGVALTALVVAPLLRPGHLLYRDAVSTPRTHLTDTTLGIGDVAPRAVPQDWFVAVASSIVDGGLVVVATLVAALVFAGVGYGRLTARLVPGAGRTGAAAAAVLAIWNPFVAERLLQGHWGLLVGYAALGWIVVAVLDLTAHPSALRWAQLCGLIAVAGLTPSGAVLALIVAATTLAGARAPLGAWIGTVGGWLAAVLPWLAIALVGGATVTSGTGGVAAFGLRSEPGLGPLGTVLGLGGIWNVDAVPASRTIGWAAVATLLLAAVLGVGASRLWRSRAELERTVGAFAVLAAVVAALLVLGTIGPVGAALDTAIAHIPGAGLFRDGQKFVALLLPAFSMATAAAVVALRRWVPAGFAVAAVALLVIAPLPDLAWGVGGKIRPISYPADWSAVARIVPADSGSVALWPADTVRRYDFTTGPSLDPSARWLRAPVIESGRLVVDGVEIDPPTAHAAAVADVLAAGGDRTALARLGVGWVLVEGGPSPRLLGDAPEFAGAQLRLYRIAGPDDRSASTAVRGTAIAAHLSWSTLVVVGVLAGPAAWWRARRRSR